MLKWKEERDGETALLIEGARRIGKSTIVEEFAKMSMTHTFSLIFKDIPRSQCLVWGPLWLKLHIPSLAAQLQCRSQRKKSLIVFDEVQNNPKARQAIKHLVKDHRYDYIETGSLISIRKNVQSIIIPSEETRISMHPMDFEEFRWALGDSVTIPLLRKVLAARQSLGDATHRKLMRDLDCICWLGDATSCRQVHQDQQSQCCRHGETWHYRSIWRRSPKDRHFGKSLIHVRCHPIAAKQECN